MSEDGDSTQLDRIDYLIEKLRSLDLLERDPFPMGIVIRMTRICEVLEEHMQDAVRSTHVRHKGDHNLLVLLLQSDRPLRNKQIGRILHLSSPSVTQRLGRLEKAGLISRNASPMDSRANEIVLTDLGRSVTAQAIDRSLAVQQRVVDSLISTEDLETFERILRNLNASLGDALRASSMDGLRSD